MELIASISVALSKMERTSTTDWPADARCTAFCTAMNSSTVGNTCAATTPAMANTPPTKIRPMKEMRRGLDLVCAVIVEALPMVCVEPSIEPADALEVAEVHPDKKRLAHNVLIRHKAP